MSNKILNLDLSKDPIMPAIVYGRVGDDRLQTVTVNLTRRDEVTDLTGYDITFEGTTHNGQTKVFDSNNVSSTAAGLKKGTFEYTFPNMAFAVAGKYEQAYFSIVKDGKRDSTAGFEIYVDGNADIDAPEAETIITEYNKLLEELKLLQDQAIAEFNESLDNLKNDTNEISIELGTLTRRMADLQALMDELVANGAMTKQQADTYYMKAGLPTVTDQDWNEIKTIGSYSVEGATGSNPPKQNAWGTLLVLGKSDSSWQKTQLFVSAIDMWFRRFDGSNWQDWSQAGSNFKAATPEEIVVGERDDVVVTPKGLKEANGDSERKKYGQHIVWGENNQVADPTTVGFGTFYASTNNEYKSLSDGESYFRYDAKGLIIVEKSGTYKVSAVVKRQYRTALTAWHYVSLTQTLVDGGSVKWDFSPIGGTVQNRNRHFAQCIITFSAGDRISFVSESNAPTASPTQLQFINIDQFCMERLGD